jgi:hypothetical protein
MAKLLGHLQRSVKDLTEVKAIPQNPKTPLSFK